jgi:hypothetical protein
MTELQEATRLVQFVFPGAFDHKWKVAIDEEGVFYLPHNSGGEWRLLTYAEINAALTKEIKKVWDIKITDYKYHDKNCTTDKCDLDEDDCPKNPDGISTPVTEVELDNELGNRITITIEGPSSTSENTVTIEEAKALRDSLNEHFEASDD